MKFNYINTLGVINRTPNSFSCHGESLRDDSFFQKLNEHLKSKHIISDIGFESTAPMNKAISAQEEMLRFEDFLNKTKTCDFADRFISFDTYRPSNFLKMAQTFRYFHPRVKFIFNDVSGVLDLELKIVLQKISELFKKDDWFYVYNFTNIPTRCEVLSHDKFLNNSLDIESQCVLSFVRANDFFKALNLNDHLILDPGFGFSKSYDQNWDLINNFSFLLRRLSSLKIPNPMVIGLSKKRFLRTKLNVSDPNLTEGLHLELINRLNSMSSRQLIFRVHDTSLTLHLGK